MKRHLNGFVRGFALLCVLALIGCATGPPKNLMLPTENALKLREQQSRSYKTTDEAELLSASAALLQDMGFNIDETNKELGILTASKMRSAVSARQQTTAILLTVLTAAAGGAPVFTPTDKEQKMRAGVVVKPLGDGHNTIVRVTFQRIVYTTAGTVSTQEMLGSDEIYTEFFDKLSKAVFLQAQDL
jgi:hypothetical protein